MKSELIKNKTPEEWFRENWEKFESSLAVENFFIRNVHSFSESFIREFKDFFNIDDIIFYTNPSIDFIRELNPNCYVGERDWNERQIEEFGDRIRWYDMFIHNWNISDEFINKWGNLVSDLEEIKSERNQNRYQEDLEYRKLINEEVQLCKEIMDVY